MTVGSMLIGSLAAMFGTAWSEIARRVGLKEAALERRLYRYGRGDLVFANKPRMEWWS